MEFSPRSLPIRLAALMTLALFPLGAISLWQTRAVVENSIALTHAAILAETERAAADERIILERASGFATGLGTSLLESRGPSASCKSALADFVARRNNVVFAGLVTVDGLMACSSSGDQIDLSSSKIYQRTRDLLQPVFDVRPNAVGTEDASMVVNVPIYRNDDLMGYTWLSLRYDLSARQAKRSSADIDVDYVIVNVDGSLLPHSVDGRTIPANLTEKGGVEALFNRTGVTFEAVAASGERRLFAVSGLVEGQAVIVGSWPLNNSFTSPNSLNQTATLAFPIVMWAAGIAVALFGLHRLVIRHVLQLRAAMRAFARGERKDVVLSLDDPPREFGVLEASYNDLVRRLTKAEIKADEDLQEKTILLREVHHRVKNNLQLIASIMNMHGRIAQTPETRRLLSQLQRRVRGLATVHQTLNDTTEKVSVDSKTLLEKLIRELVAPMEVGGQSVMVRSELEPVSLGQDQAVALSMLSAELLTNAVKYIGTPKGGRPYVRVAFGLEGEGTACFIIENSIGERPAEDRARISEGGIGRRLISAFVAQLEGEQQIEETETCYLSRITFPLCSFDAEPPADLPESDASVP